MTTYKLCLRLINIALEKGTATDEWIANMKKKLDVFYAADRLTEDQYKELVSRLDK